MNDAPPAVLTRFGDQLEHAIARELAAPHPTPPPRPGRRPPRRRIALLLTGGAALAALAAVLLAVTATGDHARLGRWSRHVLRAAQIALPRPAPHTILHLSVTQTMTAAARGTGALLAPVVNAEGWFEQGRPDQALTREQVPGRPPIWQTPARLYDPATGRVYLDPHFPPAHPHFTLTPGARAGTATLRIATADGPVREVITAAQARGLRRGTDAIQWVGSLDAHHRFRLSASVVPTARQRPAGFALPTLTSLSFPAELRRLLQSGRARVVGRVTEHGRAAIEIAVPAAAGNERSTYYVDPATYRPVEFDTYGSAAGEVTRIVFHAVERLPTAGHARLLRLPAPRDTPVDHDPAGFFDHVPPLLFW